jgi:hypothetical protein
MSIQYDSQREPLAEVIRQATDDATLVIPDLQRPYVWSPRQVILLMDSLFRGWPFGSLLLWEIKPNCFPDGEGIPYRSFWKVVDRTGTDSAVSVLPKAQPATFKMVLDGQQRVQSLVLALGGDQWGFQLYDSGWADDLQERRIKPTERWSRGSLCLDLEKFTEQYAAGGRNVRRLEVGKVLDWAVLDTTAGQSSAPGQKGYISPISIASELPGRYIRLSRLWNLAEKNFSEEEYEDRLQVVLAEHSVAKDAVGHLLRPLRQFMQLIEGVKYGSFVHTLKIDSFSPTPQWTRDDYSDAIVTIFTRLNTAGRTLTREDITLAWLKVGWIAAATDGRSASICLDQFSDELTATGLKPDNDDVVRLISFVWAVDHRAGSLLDSRDLLKGDVVRPMARDVSSEWNSATAAIIDGVCLLSERELIENAGSFNAVIVFVAWRRIVFERVAGFQLVVARKDALEKNLAARVAQFADRWIFSSQWAGFWGEHAPRNFQDVATILSKHALLVRTANADNFLETVDLSIKALMERVEQRAIAAVNALTVFRRSKVHQYYSALWVWHRLNKARWNISKVPLRTARRRVHKLEVDHAIADNWWGRTTSQLIKEARALATGTPEEVARIVPGGFASENEAQSFINLLGNCSLLDKSFNVSKSDNSMWNFLREVKEFKDKIIAREAWEAALALTVTLTEPAAADYNEIIKDIRARDTLIRTELASFIQGSMIREDYSQDQP